jgi:hypothetical protein
LPLPGRVLHSFRWPPGKGGWRHLARTSKANQARIEAADNIVKTFGGRCSSSLGSFWGCVRPKAGFDVWRNSLFPLCRENYASLRGTNPAHAYLRGAWQQGGTYKVAGKKYLIDQAATLLKFARATTDPHVAAGLLDKAADLTAKSEKALDVSPRAPDVEQREG